MAVAAVPVASDDTSHKPVRRELQRRAVAAAAAASVPASGSGPAAGSKPIGLARRLASAGFTEEKSADVAESTQRERSRKRNSWRYRTAPAEILRPAADKASEEDAVESCRTSSSSPKPFRRVLSMVAAVESSRASSSSSSPKQRSSSSPQPLLGDSLKSSGPGRRDLASKHIGIAAAACAELIRLLNKRAGTTEKVGWHPSWSEVKHRALTSATAADDADSVHSSTYGLAEWQLRSEGGLTSRHRLATGKTAVTEFSARDSEFGISDRQMAELQRRSEERNRALTSQTSMDDATSVHSSAYGLSQWQLQQEGSLAPRTRLTTAMTILSPPDSEYDISDEQMSELRRRIRTSVDNGSLVFQDEDEENTPGGDGMASLVERLTEKVREAKVETMAVLEAKKRLQDFWQSQQRLWEAEKAEMIRAWAEERAELLKRIEQGPGRIAAASKPPVQDRGSQTDLGASHVEMCRSESPNPSSSSDCGGPTPGFTPRHSNEAVAAPVLPALSCSSSASDDLGGTSASAATPTWRIPATTSPPSEFEDSNEDLQALGKHLSQRFALPGALLADIRGVLLNDRDRLSTSWPRRFTMPGRLETMSSEATITPEIFEELIEHWGATSVISSSASSLLHDLSGGSGKLEVNELFSALTSAFTVEPAEEVPDIDKCVEKMRAPKQEKPTFLARGTVSQKAAQYELEVNRQKLAGIKRRKSMPLPMSPSMQSAMPLQEHDDVKPRVTPRMPSR